MKKYILFLLCLNLFSCSTESDNNIVVDLDKIYDQPSRGFMILSPLSEMEDSVRREISFPDLSQSSDTSFSEEYFTGENEGALENRILILVTNHNSTAPSIWVDYDNDLNFAEEKRPLQFSEDHIDISFPNKDLDKKNLVFVNRLFKPDSVQMARDKESIEKYVTKGKPYRSYYYTQRRNIKVGDFSFGEDSMRIGLMDWNINGTYNDKGGDRVVFGEYGKAINGTQESEGAVVLDSATYFQANIHAFEVTDVSEAGNSMQLKSTLNSNVDERISKGDPLPDFTFKLLSDETIPISEFITGDKWLYLNFWANWCSGCHQEVADLKKIEAEYSDEVKLVSLNYNEGIEKINTFNDTYDVSWTNGFSTPEINRMLFVQGLPRNILIDSTGTIAEMNIHPATLLKRLAK